MNRLRTFKPKGYQQKLESRTQGSRPRPRTQKNLRPRTALPRQTHSRPRTGMLEAKDQGHNAKVISQKRSSLQKFRKFSEKFKRSPGKKMYSKIFSQALRRFSRQNKIGHELGPFSISQKIVLSLIRGQSIFEGLQASRPRPRT